MWSGGGVRLSALGAFAGSLLSVLHAALQEYINVPGAPAVFRENAERPRQPAFAEPLA